VEVVCIVSVKRFKTRIREGSYLRKTKRSHLSQSNGNQAWAQKYWDFFFKCFGEWFGFFNYLLIFLI
jgi:hypothetical protein